MFFPLQERHTNTYSQLCFSWFELTLTPMIGFLLCNSQAHLKPPLITVQPGILWHDGAKSSHSQAGSYGVEFPGYFTHVAK